jgi:hypothetical protein
MPAEPRDLVLVAEVADASTWLCEFDEADLLAKAATAVSSHRSGADNEW